MMFDRVKRWLSKDGRNAKIAERLEALRERTPVPVLWLFGKTQSGKTSIIKYLTGANEAEIGHGFQPCTRFSRRYQFPHADAPLLTFLDTRGLDEPGYDPTEDLAEFNTSAHAMIVVVKALDHAQENVLKHLRVVRNSRPARPIILALTCLHEAYPQQQHPQPYPFAGGLDLGVASANGQPAANNPGLSVDLLRSLEEQRRRFGPLVDRFVPLDLTRPEDGYADPTYGGEYLKQTLLQVLPAAYAQTLATFETLAESLKDIYARQALPYILGYTSLAATAGAVPIPWLDLLVLPGIQAQMINHLARLYGQPLSGARFLEVASTLGMGMLLRQASREVVKFIPYVGSVAGGMLAGSTTYALGKAFCYYYSAVHRGHIPKPEDLRRYYQEQLSLAERQWSQLKKSAPPTNNSGPEIASQGGRAS
jgi:uncharacterized protein (DUF697 family)